MYLVTMSHSECYWYFLHVFSNNVTLSVTGTFYMYLVTMSHSECYWYFLHVFSNTVTLRVLLVLFTCI